MLGRGWKATLAIADGASVGDYQNEVVLCNFKLRKSHPKEASNLDKYFRD